MPRLPRKSDPIWPGNVIRPEDPFNETRTQLQNAERLRQSGQTDKALAICEQLVKQHPRYMGALHTLGLLCADRRDYPRALGFLVRAAMLNPRHWRTLTALSNVYLKLDAPEMAAQVLEAARKINPEDAGILSTLGEIYHSQREYELAAETFSKALSLDRTLWAADMRLGQCCVHLGQYAEAAAALENVAKRRTTSINPLLWLADLPPAFVKPGLLSRIDKAVQGEHRDKADFESSVYFARAAVLDKTGRHAEAWKYLVAGNRTMFGAKRDECTKAFQLQQEILERVRNSRFKVRGGVSGQGKNAISLFILGPSRSGKTTMEKLVSAINGVKRGYENPIAENAVRHAFQDDGFLTSELYEYLPRELEKSCREIYLDDLEYRVGSARVFTNTHPGRLADAARIAAIVPNVRFIFVKRNLDDITLRIYMKKYAEGFSFSYDIEAIHSYVTWYYRMIDMLAEKFPKISLVIQYEDMIADPAAALNSAAELCGLELLEVTLPEIGDDRGCAEPYRAFMASALQS